MWRFSAFSALHHVEHGEHECKPSWSASSGAWCAWRGTGLCRPLGRLPSHALLLRRWLHSRYRKAASESARDDDETPRGRFALSLSARGRRAMLQLSIHCSSPLRKVASYSTGYTCVAGVAGCLRGCVCALSAMPACPCGGPWPRRGSFFPPCRPTFRIWSAWSFGFEWLSPRALAPFPC